MKRASGALLSFYGIGLWLVASVAGAQASRSDVARASATARRLFAEGVACVDAHDWTCAQERFGQARALRASPVIVSNHGIALVHLGRLVEASEAFRAVARDPDASPELRDGAERSIAEISPQIGRLTVRTLGDATGLSFSLDDVELDPSLVGVEMESDPGEHLVAARRAGALVASTRVHVEPGATASAQLVLPTPASPVRSVTIETPVSASSPHPDGVDELPTDRPREVYEEWWFWTVVGVVVVGAGAGVTAGVVSADGNGALPAGTLGTVDVRP